MHAMAGVALCALLAAGSFVAKAEAQSVYPTAPVAGAAGMAAPGAEASRMLVEADVLTYNLDDDSITAAGQVVIYYGDYTLLADRVEVDRSTKRVTAVGNVELTDAAGNVVRGTQIELTDDLRDGVAEALEIVTAERTAFVADRATRTDGDVTVFDEGVYLPCVDCNGERGRKPIWQIRAKRIVHRQGEKTITFENARFEFLGVPLAWVPILSQPDPSVRRKTGFLVPRPSYNRKRGAGLTTPYFYALAPNMDVTITPGYFSNQGPYLDLQFRHRVIDGDYSIRIAGLHQKNPEAFDRTSGERDWRGSVNSDGNFNINDRWSWGWNVVVATDRSYFSDYPAGHGSSDSSLNQLYLMGIDGRNRFDARAYGFFVQQEDSRAAGAPAQTKDLQDKQPFVLPSVDHKVYADDGAVLGGEFSVTTNVTALTRERADVFEYDNDGDGIYGTADGEPTRLRGASGVFTRASVDALWRRRFVDSLGQVFTPFAYVRGDVFFAEPKGSSGLAPDAERTGARVMPAAGLEYSFPVLFESLFGSQVVEPVAQLIVRPNEMETGDVVNEDAQSLVFDTTSLFDYDKFSGYDRVEGGTRLNLGVRYSGQFVNGMTAGATFGQSILLAGANSFDATTPYRTGEGSGLENTFSDYVASVNFNSNRGFFASASARFDRASFDTNRLEAQVIGLSGPLTAAVTYAFIRQQPDFGITEDRSEIQGALSLRLDENWRIYGSTRYDLVGSELVRHAFGLAYDAEEFSMSVSYSEDRTTATDPDRTLYLRLGFRTLGDVDASSDLN